MAGAAVLASSGALAQMTDAKADCNKDADAWRAAYNNHDADAVANMYDSKAGMFSNEFWTATGHDAILASFKADVSSGATDAPMICDHATTSGAYTLANGTWAATVKGADGKDASIQGHWLNVYETRDGKIVVLIHVQNTQMP